MAFDGFGGTFGAAIFGDVVFADLNSLGIVPPFPPRRRGLIGGSGFPRGWRPGLKTALPDGLDERDYEELRALGLL